MAMVVAQIQVPVPVGNGVLTVDANHIHPPLHQRTVASSDTPPRDVALDHAPIKAAIVTLLYRHVELRGAPHAHVEAVARHGGASHPAGRQGGGGKQARQPGIERTGSDRRIWVCSLSCPAAT